ncbi:MAG: 2,3,4,5-tetrahydropyridine-2,6-dicarboxylate N-succinyltransferase [Candidatus Comchoanobacterales bacterium]
MSHKQLSIHEYQEKSFIPKDIETIEKVIHAIDQGEVRLAHYNNGTWMPNTWAKQVILAYFKTQKNQLIPGNHTCYFDKIPSKFADFSEQQFLDAQIRVVPGAQVRYGAFIGAHCVLMPCFINIGAYVGQHTMIDTFASIGSCAQIGSHCHISAGAGIGGVLEPLQANPTIIEDHVFVGARSEIVEGVVVKKGAVIGMGVFISPSTKIYDRVHQRHLQGYIPENAVVIPGTTIADDGHYGLNSAIIVKYADAKTRAKVQLNELLRP